MHMGFFKQRRFTVFFFPPPQKKDHFLNYSKIQSKHPHQCQLIVWMETEVNANMDSSYYGQGKIIILRFINKTFLFPASVFFGMYEPTPRKAVKSPLSHPTQFRLLKKINKNTERLLFRWKRWRILTPRTFFFKERHHWRRKKHNQLNLSNIIYR